MVEDESLLVEDTVTCVVQVNGKLRARIDVPADISEDKLVELARELSPVQRTLGDQEPLRTIVRAPKLVNFVAPLKK